MGKTTTLVKCLVNVCGEVVNDDLVWTWHWGSGNTSLDLKTSEFKCCVSVGMGTRLAHHDAHQMRWRRQEHVLLSESFLMLAIHLPQRVKDKWENWYQRCWMLLINTLFLVYVLKHNQISTLHESIISHLLQAFILLVFYFNFWHWGLKLTIYPYVTWSRKL